MQALAENLERLMDEHPGLDSGPAIQRAIGLSPSSIGRIKRQEVAVGIDMVDKLAQAFGCEPWELLVPDDETRRAILALRNFRKQA